MKKFTSILFAVVVMINAVIAQQLNPAKRVTDNNPYAQKKLTGLNMANPLSQLYLPFGSLNSVEKRLKSTASIKLDSVVISKCSFASQPWIKSNKLIFEYDTEFKLVKIATTAGLDDWENFPETAYLKYNSSDLLDSVIIYSARNAEQMSGDMYIKFDYDESGILLKAYYYFYDGELYFGKNYSYNEAGQVSEVFMEENWWAYWTSLHKYTYDLEGKLIQYEENPVYCILATYNYDSKGNLTEENYHDWYQRRKHIYYYNAESDRVKSERYYWSDDVLREHNTEVYNYLDLKYSDLVNLNLSIFNLNNELDEVEYIPDKLVSSILENDKKTEYFYSSIKEDQKSITEINDKQNSDFSVFPNPATDRVTFTCKTGYARLNLKIYNLMGECITDQEISSNETINLENIANGIYIYRLSDKKQILHSGKLVIK